MAPDFTKRASQIEVMDDLECNGPVVNAALRELEIINRLLGGNQVTIQGLQLLLSKVEVPADRPLVVADVGCGGGDMLKLIDKWASRRGIAVHLIGIDANPNIIDYARKNCADMPNAEFMAINIFSEEFSRLSFDVVVNTLFLHHFTFGELRDILKRYSQQAGMGIIINDIHRHPFAYYSIKHITRAFSKSPMVVHDAPLSVLRAFSRHDLEQLFQSAQIPHWQINWKWAFRWQAVAWF
jgi:2-polyprenyl-3-methyl-5-hydroxy-6-metoxy-1,4-benzoquinol methylase